MIPRGLRHALERGLRSFPAAAVPGPRQAGKTTRVGRKGGRGTDGAGGQAIPLRALMQVLAG